MPLLQSTYWGLDFTAKHYTGLDRLRLIVEHLRRNLEQGLEKRFQGLVGSTSSGFRAAALIVTLAVVSRMGCGDRQGPLDPVLKLKTGPRLVSQWEAAKNRMPPAASAGCREVTLRPAPTVLDREVGSRGPAAVEAGLRLQAAAARA